MDPTAFLIAILIFLLRILDVSIGTVRVIYTVRGKRLISAALGIVESAIWIFAISRVLIYMDSPVSIAGWAFGFGVGSAVGITLEKWIGTGNILMRVISMEKARQLRNALLEAGVGVTALPGEGRSGQVLILFVVAPRRRGKRLLELVQQIDPVAFITIDPISHAVGGYVPTAAAPSSLRK